MTKQEYEDRMEKLDALKAETGIDLTKLMLTVLEIGAEAEQIVKEAKEKNDKLSN